MVYFRSQTSALVDQADDILAQIIGVEWEDYVELAQDEDNFAFPEVMIAAQAASVEAGPLCLCCMPVTRKWGVGVAADEAQREATAKLALAVALALGMGKADVLSAAFDGFGELCAAASPFADERPSKRPRRDALAEEDA